MKRPELERLLREAKKDGTPGDNDVYLNVDGRSQVTRRSYIVECDDIDELAEMLGTKIDD